MMKALRGFLGENDMMAYLTMMAIPSLDDQIAATANRQSLTVVTRNSLDFVKTGGKVLNPF